MTNSGASDTNKKTPAEHLFDRHLINTVDNSFRHPFSEATRFSKSPRDILPIGTARNEFGSYPMSAW